MNKATRIAVFHESPLWGECLASALRLNSQFEASSFDMRAFDASKLATFDPQVMVVDLGCQFILEHVLDKARHAAPNCLVIAIISENIARETINTAAARVTSYICAEAPLEELRKAIDGTIRGEIYCSPSVANRVVDSLGQVVRSLDRNGSFPASKLTTREIEILHLIADDQFSNKQIARRLNLSLYTVKNHVHNILEKLSVNDRQAAAKCFLGSPRDMAESRIGDLHDPVAEGGGDD